MKNVFIVTGHIKNSSKLIANFLKEHNFLVKTYDENLNGFVDEKANDFCLIAPICAFANYFETLKNDKNINLKVILVINSECESIDKILGELPLSEKENFLYALGCSRYVFNTFDKEEDEIKSFFDNLIKRKNVVDNMLINFNSFGYKYGKFPMSDMVIDVRALPNPFWVNELKQLCGLDKEVANYILSFKESKMFLEKLTSFLDLVLQEKFKNGKMNYTISIGCTGGRHRSVFVCEYLMKYFTNKYDVVINHLNLETIYEN